MTAIENRIGHHEAGHDTQALRMRCRRVQLRRHEFAGICVLSCLIFLAFGAPPAEAIEPGEQAPSFEAPALQGSGTVALEDYRGKVVFLDFWASWCPPCLESLPQIERLRRAFPKEDFQVLAVNVDGKPQKARKFLERNPVGYPSASDPDGTLPKRYELKKMPTSFLIDRSGIVRYVHSGFKRDDVDILHRRIKQMLEQP